MIPVKVTKLVPGTFTALAVRPSDNVNDPTAGTKLLFNVLSNVSVNVSPAVLTAELVILRVGPLETVAEPKPVAATWLPALSRKPSAGTETV